MTEPPSAPDAPTELALPLVVRLERDALPLRTAALEAAARAVLVMLTDGRDHWPELIDQWDGQRIRKVVRRARQGDWRRAEALPGLSVEHDGATVRVFPPVPVDDWPPELARLQVGGTDLPTDEPGPPALDRPLVLLSPHVRMTAGKAMAQAGHAAQLGWRAMGAAGRRRWHDAGFPLSVRTAGVAGWDRALRTGAPVVQDAGFTEVEPGSRTALIVGL